MEITDIPLDQLHLSNGGLAVRHVADAAADKALANNIAIHGLIVPLLVRPVSTGGFAVVEGNRRLKGLRAQKVPPATAPCIIDPSAGIAQGLSANTIRAGLNPMDLCDGLSALVRQGTSLPDLARAYSLKPRELEQSLALAGLATSIKDKVRAGKLDEEAAQALTLVKDHGAQERLLKQCNGNAGAIRAAIHDAHPLLDNALFEAKEYQVAGGAFVVDLFSDDSDPVKICADDAIFWRLQNAAIDERVTMLAGQGWKAVLRHEGDMPPASRHWPAPAEVKKSERKFHTLRYTVDADGAYTQLHYAEPDRGHKRKAAKDDGKPDGTKVPGAGAPAAGAVASPSASEGESAKPFSQSLQAFLARHRAFQVKEAICQNDADLGLRVLAFLLITHEQNRDWDQKPQAAGVLTWGAAPISDDDLRGRDALGAVFDRENRYNLLAEEDPATLWKRLALIDRDGLVDLFGYVAAAIVDTRRLGAEALARNVLAEEPVPGRATFVPDKSFWAATSKAYMVGELTQVLGDRLTEEARKALTATKFADLVALCALWFTNPELIDLGKLGLADKTLPPDLRQRFKSWVPQQLALPTAPGDEKENAK